MIGSPSRLLKKWSLGPPEVLRPSRSSVSTPIVRPAWSFSAPWGGRQAHCAYARAGSSFAMRTRLKAAAANSSQERLRSAPT